MANTPQPYVTGGSNKKQQQQSGYSTQQPQNPYTPSSNTAGSSYTPSSSTNYASSYSNYASNPSAPSAYAPASSAYAPASSAYAPAPSGGYSSSPTYTSSRAGKSSLPDFSQALNLPSKLAASLGSSSQGATPASTQGYAPGYSSSTTNTASQSPYGSIMTALGQGFSGSAANPPSQQTYGSAIAIPVHKPGGYYGGDGNVVAGFHAVSGLNSTTYAGGPTGGLISEGNPTICHKVDYEIKGHEMQLVEIELDPQETVIAEAGALMYLEDGIDFKTKFGDGSEPKEGFFKKLLKAGGRLLMGESLFITHFTNQGQRKARVAFAAPFPGSILPINLQNIGGKIICEKDAFLCAAKGTKLSVHLHKKFGSGLFGGEGFILQKLQGDGMAFIHAGGMVIRKELRGEKLRIDTGCVVAFTEGINFDIQFVPGLKTMFFGGEGLFLATLQGTGTVWLQSLPFSRFADRVIQYAPSIGGRRQGEGSALTGRFGDVVSGGGLGVKF